jgi:hypothetical protein
MRMADHQLDLFTGSEAPSAGRPTFPLRPGPADPASLDDTALLAAIPASNLSNGPSLAREAGRRRLAVAIPVLQDYCRRFAGFGTAHPLPEQVAALEALGAIGGPVAAATVVTIIIHQWVQGPTLPTAVAVAARLAAPLPAASVLSFLRHPDPTVRADACHLACGGSEIVATLLDLMGDLHDGVCMAAACALARLCRSEARPLLKRALNKAPTVRVIEAIAVIADEECIVLLGRIALGASSDLAGAARDALDTIEHPLAARLLERLR